MAEEYEIGYGKPPKHSQFKPGQSGNKKGRPKGSKDTLNMAKKILNEKIEVTDRGKKKKKTKQEIILTQLANDAAKGYGKATESAIELMFRIDERDEQREKTFKELDKNKKNILDNFLNRHSQNNQDENIQNG